MAMFLVFVFMQQVPAKPNNDEYKCHQTASGNNHVGVGMRYRAVITLKLYFPFTAILMLITQFEGKLLIN